MINRRSLFTGLISFAPAPAIVRANGIMPIKTWRDPPPDGRVIGFENLTTLEDVLNGIFRFRAIHADHPYVNLGEGRRGRIVITPSDLTHTSILYRKFMESHLQ